MFCILGGHWAALKHRNKFDFTFSNRWGSNQILANYDTMFGDGAYHQQDDDQHDPKDRAGSFAGIYIFEVDMMSCKMSTSEFDPYKVYNLFSVFVQNKI